MARAAARVAGKTNLGSRRVQGTVHVETVGTADKPSLLALDAVDDDGVVTTNYLWVDQNGDLRIGTAVPTDEDSDGTIVGTQS